MTNNSTDSRHYPCDILAPIATESFFAQYWEQKPLHIDRNSLTYFSSALTLSDIESLLSTSDLFFPAVQLTRSGTVIPVPEYADEDNRIVPSRLIQYYKSGSTIVISQAQKKLPGLAGLSRYVQSVFNLQCQTNVYLSPPGQQGFNAHFDTHDVLVLQVSGNKTFRFYGGGVDLPLRTHRFDAALDIAGELQEEIQLRPGDTLYIPRGVMHDAQADQAEPSLHITLGVFPVVMCDLLQQIIQGMAEQDVRYRRSVPYDVLAENQSYGSPAIQALEICSNSLLGGLVSDNSLIEAVSKLKDTLSVNQTPDSTGLLNTSRRNESITLESVVIVRRQAEGKVERLGEQVKLRSLGRILEFTGLMAAAVEYIVIAGSVKVQDLPKLDDEQKLALCQQLLDEHILELEHEVRTNSG